MIDLKTAESIHNILSSFEVNLSGVQELLEKLAK